MYHSHPQLIVVTGGKGKLAHVPEAVPCASVMRRELIELGVPAAGIREEIGSGNTCEQLQFIKTVFSEFPIAALRILSNRYHIARIGAFLTSDPQLRDWCISGRIELQAAEDIVLQHDPARWSSLIAEAYASQAMHERIANEERGVQAIRTGTYKCQPLP